MKKARRKETTKTTHAVAATNMPHVLAPDDLTTVVGGEGLVHCKRPL
jgi:hypothetical protein